MKYLSTRQSDTTKVSFEEAVLTGLAPDGGLYVPETIPLLSSDLISSWADLSFAELAFQLFRLFVEKEEISDQDLLEILTRSFSPFTHADVTPLTGLPQVVPQAPHLWVLELFHGPTFAFKDVALQVLGNLFEFFLNRKRKQQGKELKMTILGATSGDTGGAAIYGLRGKLGIDVFILHPYKRISPVQELQMTSVLDSNVHNVAVEGTFDDCQEVVKTLFSDAEFKNKYQLGAVNSINWARILAQMSYYFYSYFAILKKVGKKVQVRYSVPTGNFGDILAGFYAKQSGLPIDHLIIATNENDILDRFLKTGSYEKLKRPDSAMQETSQSIKFEQVKQTHSPAMDILISSNFERLLYHLLEQKASSPLEAATQLASYMKDIKTKGGFSVDKQVLEMARSHFSSCRVSNEDTLDAITRYYHTSEKSYVLDPHTAVGVVAAENQLKQSPSLEAQVIVLGTASPGKFPQAVMSAINDTKLTKKPDFTPIAYQDFAPQPLVDLNGLPTRCIQVSTQGDFSKAVQGVRHVIQGVVGDVSL